MKFSNEIPQVYVEENLRARDIIARGFDAKMVRWVQRRVDLNEYKREQAAPGLKVTSRGADRAIIVVLENCQTVPFDLKYVISVL